MDVILKVNLTERFTAGVEGGHQNEGNITESFSREYLMTKTGQDQEWSRLKIKDLRFEIVPNWNDSFCATY